jgi:hypothetical protein
VLTAPHFFLTSERNLKTLVKVNQLWKNKLSYSVCMK